MHRQRRWAGCDLGKLLHFSGAVKVESSNCFETCLPACSEVMWFEELSESKTNYNPTLQAPNFSSVDTYQLFLQMSPTLSTNSTMHGVSTHPSSSPVSLCLWNSLVAVAGPEVFQVLGVSFFLFFFFFSCFKEFIYLFIYYMCIFCLFVCLPVHVSVHCVLAWSLRGWKRALVVELCCRCISWGWAPQPGIFFACGFLQQSVCCKEKVPWWGVRTTVTCGR